MVDTTLQGLGKKPAGGFDSLLSDFVSSIVGVETNIAGSLPSVPPPALGPPQGPPHPRDTARKRGNELVEKFKRVGEGVGRFGGGGEKFKRAAAELVREANTLPKGHVLRQAMKKEAERLRLKGSSMSHK